MIGTDERIPVVVGTADQARSGDRVLRLETAGSAAGHPAGCACCRPPRSIVALALGGLFLERARDPSLDFRRVLVVLPGPAAGETVERAIEGDVLARARYRFAGRA